MILMLALANLFIFSHFNCAGKQFKAGNELHRMPCKDVLGRYGFMSSTLLIVVQNYETKIKNSGTGFKLKKNMILTAAHIVALPGHGCVNSTGIKEKPYKTVRCNIKVYEMDCTGGVKFPKLFLNRELLIYPNTETSIHIPNGYFTKRGFKAQIGKDLAIIEAEVELFNTVPQFSPLNTTQLGQKVLFYGFGDIKRDGPKWENFETIGGSDKFMIAPLERCEAATRICHHTDTVGHLNDADQICVQALTVSINVHPLAWITTKPGDSGSPIYCEVENMYHLCGIMSFAQCKDCDFREKNKYLIIVAVGRGENFEWIKQIMNNKSK